MPSRPWERRVSAQAANMTARRSTRRHHRRGSAGGRDAYPIACDTCDGCDGNSGSRPCARVSISEKKRRKCRRSRSQLAPSAPRGPASKPPLCPTAQSCEPQRWRTLSSRCPAPEFWTPFGPHHRCRRDNHRVPSRQGTDFLGKTWVAGTRNLLDLLLTG